MTCLYATPESKAIVQGIAEPLGSYYAARMKAYGTNIVAGISAGQGGRQFDDIPTFDLVEEAVNELGEIDTTLIFVEPYQVLDAALEAIAARIKQIVLICNGIPPLDTIALLEKARDKDTLILGPGSAGIIVPEKIWLGTLETQFYNLGNIGLIGRSDSLSYEVALALKQVGLGQSIAVSLGTEEIIGSSFETWLQILESDRNTEVIVLIEQLNCTISEATARYIANHITKPIVAFIAGIQAPVTRTFKDALTITSAQLSYSIPAINPDKQTIAALQKAKVSVTKRLFQVPELVKKALKEVKKKSET